jgi:hypothetical protein
MERDYYPLEDAAKILNCSVDDIIHQGVKGNIEIHILLANWNTQVFEGLGFDVIDISVLYSPHSRKISKSCLARFEAGPATAVVSLDPEVRYTHNYRHPLALVGECWEYDAQAEQWRYPIFNHVVLYRPNVRYPTENMLQEHRQRGGNIDDIMPPPILLSECKMVVLAGELERLKLSQPKTTTASSSSKTEFVYQEREEDFDNWRNQTGVALDVLKVEETLQQVRQWSKNKKLWNIKATSFRRGFWQPYSQKHGIQKKGGRQSKNKI